MTPNKEKLLAALLTSRSKKEAAAAAGIAERTMRTYFEDPEFCQRYREAFAGVIEDATRQAQALLMPALSTLQTVLASGVPSHILSGITDHFLSENWEPINEFSDCQQPRLANCLFLCCHRLNSLNLASLH